MKKFGVFILLLPLCAFAERFIVDKQNSTTVDVFQNGDMLNVICRFPAKDKFDPSINAQLNDQKSQRLFIEGLIRYFKVGSNGTMEMSGQQALGIKEDGEYVTYQFAIPKSGCKIVQKIKPSRSQGVAVPMNQATAAKCQEMMEAIVKQLMTNKVDRTTNGGIRK